MRHDTLSAAGMLRAIAALIGVVALGACANGTSTAAPVSAADSARSPLAAPPASMMTPHGY